MNGEESAAKPRRFDGSFALLLALLGGTLAALCHEGFRPCEVFWANDQPLGALMESSSRLPGAFFGSWSDFYWLGGQNVAFPPNLSNLLMAILSPQHHLKFYAPLSMLFLGFGAWFFFRQLRFAPMVCVVAGVGAGLNMHFFSNACWGLGNWNVCCGMVFIALGILAGPQAGPLWVKGLLAGFSTGMAVMEGFDVGAILSVYVGIFLVFVFLTAQEEPARRAGKAALAGVLVAAGAVLISLSTIYTLVVTQIQGTGGGGQSQGDKEARWAFTTQWSIPKLESLRVLIPGLFGYRMMDYTTSTNKAGVYWGKIAEDPRVADLESGNWQVRTNAAASLGLSPQIQDLMAGKDVAARQAIVDQVKGQVQRRHTGNGEYAGVLVCLLAVFALAGAGAKSGPPYSRAERRAIWFWAGAALFSLLAAWGRHGFVYGLVYQLPFLTNIRSPMKFMHPLNISLIILCGYGLEALYRGWLAPCSNRTGSFLKDLLAWWKKASGFEAKWGVGSAVVLAAALAGYFLVRASKGRLTHSLEHNGFDPALSPQIARFCIGEVGLFVVFLALSLGVVLLILSGVWAGRRAPWAWVFLSALMIGDLSRADIPWVRYYNYKQKLSGNPVVEILRHQPWEHRVVSRLLPTGPYDTSTDGSFGWLCHWWLENDYPVNDIESLEIDQAPRLPVLDSTYLGNFNVRSAEDLSPAALQWVATHPREDPSTNPLESLVWTWVVQAGPVARMWRLTNTRYIFADARLADVLNQFAEPPGSFRAVLRANIAPKPGVTQPEDAGDMTVKEDKDGSLALIEYTGALPRAKLYANWRALDDAATLRELRSRQFDPQKRVLVAANTPVLQPPSDPDADPGTVRITQYQSKDVLLEAEAKTPAVLLLNDRTGDFWNVWVDRKPAALLRCNDIMQGVFVPAGRHGIEFRFEPPQKMLCVSLGAFALAVLLGGTVAARHFLRNPRSPAPPPGANQT